MIMSPNLDYLFQIFAKTAITTKNIRNKTTHAKRTGDKKRFFFERFITTDNNVCRKQKLPLKKKSRDQKNRNVKRGITKSPGLCVN